MTHTRLRTIEDHLTRAAHELDLLGMHAAANRLRRELHQIERELHVRRAVVVEMRRAA